MRSAIVDDMLELGRDVENGDACFLEIEDGVLYEFDGADIESLAGLHDDEDARSGLDLARQDDLLLVAAGEEARRLLRRAQAHVVALDKIGGVPCEWPKSRMPASRSRRPVVVAQHEVGRDRIVERRGRSTAGLRE